jgi:replicative DNA helicase
MKPLPNVLDRLPPQNLEAERGVLGSVLLDPRSFDDVVTILRPEDFYSDAHMKLYGHLCKMNLQRVPIDVTLLVERLRGAGELEAVGGMAYLAEVAHSVAVVAHVLRYAEIVREASARRRIINAASQAMHDAYETGVTVEHVLSMTERALQGVRTGNYDSDPVSIDRVLLDVMAEIDEILAGRQSPGIPIGLPEFDDRFGGIFGGELTILGARPGQGKTSLALQMAGHVADLGYITYFATLEMSRVELALKRICTASGVSNQQVRTGRIGTSEQERLVRAANVVARPNFFLHDWPEIRPGDIERAARRLGAQVIFVDYLQYVSPPDPRKKRYEQVGDIARGLKAIARHLNIPVVACAQIGRKAEESKKEERPKLSHLRESGNIENDADVALLLFRPADGIVGKFGGKHTGDKWDAELDVSKNRKGETGRLHLDWHGPTTTFSCHGYERPEMF